MVPLNKICVVLFTVTMVAQGMRLVYEENISIQSEDAHANVRVKHDHNRVKRSSGNFNGRQNCNSWSSWTNTHAPTDQDPVDKEQVTRKEQDAFCPPEHGGFVNKSECNDEKGEEFTGNKTSPDNDYFISCNNDALVGVECVLLKANITHCPNVKIRYFCYCSNETSVTSSNNRISTTTKSQRSVPKNDLSANSTNTDPLTRNSRTNGFSAGRLFVPWWALNLFLTLLLFTTSICTTVCLYKHLHNKLRDGKSGNKISPTA